MAKDQIVSIDIGTNTIKLVQLEQTASGIRIVSAGVEPYPRKSATQKISKEAISQTLQSVWRKVQGRKNSVVLSIPRSLVASRRLTDLPVAVKDEQLPDLVAMHAETELPFRIENVVYDYHDVRRSAHGVSIELIAAKRESVQQQIDYLKPLGIVPKTVIPSSLATGVLAGMYQANHGENVLDTMTMVVDIGAGRTDLSLISGNVQCFSRSFPIGGNHLTHLYQNKTDDDFETAESRKIADATLDYGDKASATLTYDWADRLVSELKRSIGAAKRDLNVNGGAFVSEIWLCGGSSRIAGLANYIADQLQTPARLWNPFDAFKMVWDERQSASQSIDGFSDTLAVALGLGINALTHQVSLDLLPKEEKAKFTQAEQRKRTLAAVAAGLTLFIGLGLGSLTWNRAHQAKVAVLDQQIRSTRRAESNAQRTLVKDLAIANLLAPRVSSLDILREFSTRFADRTKMAWKTFNISHLDDLDKAKIAFNIEAASHQDVSKMISIMGQSRVFTNIKAGQVTSIERNKKPIFQAQVTCNLEPDAVRVFAQAYHLNRDQKSIGTETEVKEVSQEDRESTIEDEESTVDESANRFRQNKSVAPRRSASQDRENRTSAEIREPGENNLIVEFDRETEIDRGGRYRSPDEAETEVKSNETDTEEDRVSLGEER